MKETSRILSTISEVRQGCSHAQLLFIMVMDETMKKIIRNKTGGINWNLTKEFQDLQYADDICYFNIIKEHFKTTALVPKDPNNFMSVIQYCSV